MFAEQFLEWTTLAVVVLSYCLEGLEDVSGDVDATKALGETLLEIDIEGKGISPPVCMARDEVAVPIVSTSMLHFFTLRKSPPLSPL